MKRPNAGNDRLAQVLFMHCVRFEWWSQLTRRFESASPRVRWTVIGLVMGLALLARLWAQTLPGNYDFDSWFISASRALEGQDPYATSRYNYAPPWLGVLSLVMAVDADPQSFRLGIALILTAVDIGIALILIRKGLSLPACLFLLSPVTIAISGQHQQFDNIAVFLALAAMLMVGGDAYRRIDSRDWAVVGLLGLSLSFKHIFLIFPIWLAMRAGTWKRRLLYLCGPLAIFALVLAPAYLYSPNHVMTYVINYRGANNSPILYALLPDQIVPGLFEHGVGRPLAILLLILAGLLFRRVSSFNGALIYSITVVLFSWAVVNQYLAIPMAAIAVFLNLGFLWWLLLASIYLAGDPGVLGVWGVNSIQPHLLLEYDVVAQDLFLPMLLGWLILTATIHRETLRRILLGTRDG